MVPDALWHFAVLSTAVDGNIIHITLSISSGLHKQTHCLDNLTHHHHHQIYVEKDKQTWYDWVCNLERNMIQILMWAMWWLAEQGLDDLHYKEVLWKREARKERVTNEKEVQR